METIKCGRNTYELRTGDYILDNGKCLQYCSTNIHWSKPNPILSKKEFEKFKNNPKSLFQGLRICNLSSDLNMKFLS